jgi:hypothetical protein
VWLRRTQDSRVNDTTGHAFISYVHEDSNEVARLQRRLEDAGVPVWRDTQNLWPGQDWRRKIRQAIQDDALVFIACFSSKSLTRRRSYQNEELVLAIEELRRRGPDDPWLIPVRFTDCDIPDRDIGGGRSLRSIQCADLFGDNAEEGFTRLITSVMRFLEIDGEGHTTATLPDARKTSKTATGSSCAGLPMFKTKYVRRTRDGRQQVRYAICTDYNGRRLTKFIGEAEWKSLDFHFYDIKSRQRVRAMPEV